MSKSLTIPSLTMKIFRTHFMPSNTIYQILGKVEEDIRHSFSGGAVDVYVPSNHLGEGIYEDIYGYDLERDVFIYYEDYSGTNRKTKRI